jgi:filamentous hemagglutinin family protein
VVHGSADFSAAGDVLEIRNDPGTIIDWGGFSIGADELTRFLQNSADSAVLNRVVGSDASEVLGTLASNGRVFLINPNGVVFGDGGVIDTAGFVASTLEMTDEDFLAGDLRLAGDGESGRIINAGVLTTRGGNVYFVAPDIENSGIVHAEDGSLTLAAGREVRIASLDEPGVEMIVQAPEDSVLNLGELIVERGAVRALAGTIEHSGAIEASSVSVDADGAIVLRAQGDLTLAAGSRLDASGADGGDIDVVSDSGTLIAEGSIDASGSVSDGGRVRLLGEQVGVVGDAVVDATGAGNGGEVLIGGNQEGQGPEPNASRTFIGADARVDTSSTGAEHGGRIIAFSEDETRVFGDLVARGGPEAGDGGFIETSGGSLQVMTTPDAGAAAGAPGDWLIDPDLVVIAGDATVNSEVTPATGAGGEDLFVGDPAGAADSLIGAQVIENSLEGGTSVIVRTGQTADSIIVDAPLEFAVDTPGLSLTLDANQNIIVNQLIRNTSATPIDINLAFGFGVTVGADLITGTNFDGTIAFQPVEGGSVNFVGASTLGGAVSANAVDFVMSDPTADVFIEGLASIGSLQLDAGRIEFDFVDPGPEPSVNFISGTLAMTGGTLTGVGDLQVSTLDWFGGEFAGSGSTFAFGAATIDLRGPGDDFAADPLALRDRTLRLGASSQSWNEGDIRMSGTGILDVSSDLTSNFVSPIEIVNEGGSPRVEIRPGATYTTSGLGLSVQIAFDNDGTFDFANDIDLIGGGSSTGTFALGPAATLGLGGDHQLSGPIGVGGVGSRIEQFVGTTFIDGQLPGLDQVDLPRRRVRLEDPDLDAVAHPVLLA